MQSDRFEQKDYPWTPVIVGNTPAAFEHALTAAKTFPDQYNPPHKIVVLNSWNEWTEGSYLLPEKKYGTNTLIGSKKYLAISKRK
jgi:hypothetical protein